eukprot:17328_3
MTDSESAQIPNRPGLAHVLPNDILFPSTNPMTGETPAAQPADAVQGPGAEEQGNREPDGISPPADIPRLMSLVNQTGPRSPPRYRVIAADAIAGSDLANRLSAGLGRTQEVVDG